MSDYCQTPYYYREGGLRGQARVVRGWSLIPGQISYSNDEVTDAEPAQQPVADLQLPKPATAYPGRKG